MAASRVRSAAARAASAAPPIPRALRELCARVGIATAYRDGFAERRVPPVDSLLAVLRACGIAIQRVEDAKRCTAALERRRWTTPTDGCVVSWGDAAARVALRVPARARRAPIRVTVANEDGERVLHDLAAGARTVREERTVDGIAYAQLELRVAAPGGAGVHELAIEWGDQRAVATWIVAPERAHPLAGRRAMVVAPLFALRTGRSLGVGDFGDLGDLAEAVGRLGGDGVATLPILAAFLDEPFDPSPYAPVSRLFWNELYLNLATVPEVERLGDGSPRLARTAAREARALASAADVDYRRAMRLKRACLERCAARLVAAGGARLAAFETFLARSPSTLAYARFRANVERRGTSWRRWPSAERDGVLADLEIADPRVRYHAYVQWLAHEQLGALAARARAAGLGLLLDHPVGVHADGFDVWAQRSAFLEGCSLGAPPDDFFRRGQGWGVAALDPSVVASRPGIDYLRQALATVMTFAGALRIDHVMGLHRTFVIPFGAEPADGVYVSMPREALYAMLCLQSVRSGCALVGEDLGTVPRGVRPAMRRHGLLRTRVLGPELDRHRGDPLPNPPSTDTALAFGTHDMATFAGFLAARDVNLRRRLGLLGAAAARDARAERAALVRRLAVAAGARGARAREALLAHCWSWMAASPARLVLVNLEDLWLETVPHNVPGTGLDHPNWRHKNRFTLEEILEDRRWTARLARVLARDGR
ncbi:MAG: 4-alpha-glucanotransferase [bacterium]